MRFDIACRAAALLSAGLLAQASAAAPVPPAGSPHIIDVQMKDCSVMVMALPVSAEAATALLPPKYEFFPQPDGSALVYGVISHCDITDNVTGHDLPSVDFGDWWLTIKNPLNPAEGITEPPVTQHIEGAAWDMPNQYVYVFKADTVADWLKTDTAAIHFYKEKVKSVSPVDPTPFSAGKVVEMKGTEYSWSDVLPCNAGTLKDLPDGGCWMFPGYLLPVAVGLPHFPMGFNLHGYQDRIGGGGQKALHCLLLHHGQGVIAMTPDARSGLAKTGLFPGGVPTFGYYFYSYANCHLIMSQQ